MKKLIPFMFLFACGGETKETITTPPPGPGPGPGGDLTYPEMQAKLNQYCVSCHATAGFMQNENALRQSDVRERLVSRTMPPPDSSVFVPETDRQAMINFF